MQDRLGLIVGGMGGDDIASPQPGGRLFEELIACLPGRRFQAVAAGRAGQIEPHPADFAGHAEPPAQLDDHRLIGVRFAGAQLMVEMGGNQTAFAGGLRARAARSRATLSAPPETASRTVTSCQAWGGQAAARRDSSG